MQISLYTTDSDKRCLDKDLYNELTLEGALRDESSVITPTITINANNLSGFNYLYIPDFGRYYFITDIESVRTGVWRIRARVDVLTTYRETLRGCPVVASAQESPDYETYVPGAAWQRTVKTKTDVLNFPNGFLDQGEFILITSGGVAV